MLCFESKNEKEIEVWGTGNATRVKVRKKYWLLPIVIILLALGALLILTEGSTLAPFIYASF